MAAMSEYQRAYRERNREKINAQMRTWHAANRERVKEQKRVYNALRRDDQNIYKSDWAKANPEKVKAARAKWAAANPDWRSVNRAKYRARYVLKNLGERARKAGRPFALTEDVIIDMLTETKVCPVLGIPLSHAVGRARDDSPSFDCFYPEFGYVPGNVFVMSRRANTIKNNATLAEIQALARWMDATTVVIKEKALWT